MLALPFAAEAQVLGSQHNTTATGIVNLPYDSFKSTGIVFHVTACDTSRFLRNNIYVWEEDFVTPGFLIYETDGTFVRSIQSASPLRDRVMHFAVVTVRTTEGVRTPEIIICAHDQLPYTVTVAIWDDQGENDNTPKSSYYYVRSASASVDTGLAFHRSGSTCRFNDVQLVNPPSWLELRKYTAGGTPDGAAGTRFTVRMEKDHAEDRHVRLQLKTGVTIPLGQQVVTMAAGRHVASAGCSGGLAATVTLTYTLNITNQANWAAQGGEDITPWSLRADAIGAAPVALAATLHRSSELCRYTAVSLAGDAGSFLELRAYATATGRQAGAAAASLPGVFMQRGAAGDSNVQVFSKSGASVTPGTKAVTVVVQAGARCGSPQGLPSAQSIVMQLTVLPSYSSPESWQAGSLDDAVPSSPFSPRAVAESSNPTPVGIYLQRTSASCSSMIYELLSGQEVLDFHLADGNLSRRDRHGDLAQIDIASNRIAGLYFEPGARLEPGSELPVSIQLRANTTCSQGPAPQTLAFTLTMGTAEAWSTLPGDVATATLLFPPASLRAAATATDTGVRFHRGTSACPQVDVEVRPAASMEVRKYNGSTADGAAAPSLANVRMQAGHANDRRVGVQFKAGVRLPLGLFTATVVAKAASGCTDVNAPLPLTMTYELAVLDSWPWRAAAQDNLSAPATLDILGLRGTGPQPTGLRVHRNTPACSSTDVALASDAPAYLSLQRYSSSGPEGAAARSLSGVAMPGSGAGDRYVQVAIAGGTTLTAGATIAVSLTVSANSSCSGAVGVPAAQGLVGYVIIGSAGLGTEKAMQAGTALAVRALGIETLGAVMARPGAASDASASAQLLGMLAAKEAELESGEIDLRTFLAGQQFSLPLSSSASGLPSGLMLWGRAAAYEVGSESEDGVQVDSDLFSGSFGVDYRFTEGMLLGLGYGRHGQKGQYRNGGSAGSYQLDLNLYQPYAAARIGPGWLVAYGSQGTGNLLLETQDNLNYQPHLKADYVGWGLGWYNDIERWDLRLRAGASAGELEFEEDRFEMNAEAGTARLAVAYAPGRNLVVDIPMQPEFEVAWSDEWGDVAGDASWLVALVFDYAGTGPMHLRAAYRHAVSGGSDLAGVELDVRVDPNRGGLGPSFALRPRYGIEAGADLFEQAARPYDFTAGDDRGRRLQAEMAWGLPVSGGVLKPYSDWSLDSDQGHAGSLGMRLGTGAYGDWNLGWRRAGRDDDELHLELRIGD